MILDKMGIDKKSVTHKVVTNLMTTDGNTLLEMYETAKKGQHKAAFQKMMVYMGTLISRNIPKGAIQDAMNHVTGSSDDIAAVSKTLGYAAGGQYEDATKVIGEIISDKFLITTAGKIAVEIVDYQVNSWKNSEVEAAYKAYKNGADGKFWGYNVDASDFDGVWSQMREIIGNWSLKLSKKSSVFAKNQACRLLQLSAPQSSVKV
jgi:hypothetical protein